MNNNKINVYYGITFKNISNKKYIENEIMNDNYLKQLSYYYKDNLNVPNKLSNSLNTITIDFNNKIYKCLNKEYNSLKEIIKDHFIVPKFFTENFDIENYKKKLTNLEHNKDILKNKLFDKYNKLFNKHFDVYEGFNSIYEWYTGSIYFKDYEWEEINNKIKDVFMKKDSYYKYSLPMDNGIILRSSDIYYYFSTDVSRFEKPTLKQIHTWYNNCLLFIKDILNALKDFKINSNYDKRLLLGVIDNFRNMILIMFNAELLSKNNGKNFIININTIKDKQIDNYINLVNTYIELINDITINNEYNNIVERLINLIKEYKKVSIKTLNRVDTLEDSYLLSKCFNPLREIDNYIENYIVCNETFKNIKEDNINLIGVLYGGLELPFIIKSIYKNKNIDISFIYQNYGMYLDRQNKERNILINDLIEIGSFNKNNNTYLVDDNMMSGITMQFIYNQLTIRDFNNINGMIIIRHPNMNRLPQLAYFKTAVELDKIDKNILGMITDTPYSKIKYGSNYNNMFVNELNIFSIMTEVFLKALYKNNSFIKDSQVDIFLGYSEGKND